MIPSSSSSSGVLSSLLLLLLVVILFTITLHVAVVESSTNQCNNIDVKNILGHLRALDTIANNNNGNRAAGTSGYLSSVGYIVSQLSGNTDFDVTIQDFTFSIFRIIGTPRLSQIGPVERSFAYPSDFRVLTGSGSGSFSGRAFAIPNFGCNQADYASFPSGAIAIVQRGICTFTEKATVAVAASAGALIVYNTDGGGSFSGSCTTDLPVYGVSAYLGVLFTQPSILLTINVETVKEESVTSNVLADTTAGDPTKIIVVGSHLDSVQQGPGINDNGSGSSTNLELALTVSRCLQNPVNKIRFAWWGAEELGLLGSRHYVEDLKNNNPDELKNILLNINIDMLGSPNFFYGIYNGSGADSVIRDKCVIIQKEFEASISGQSKPFSLTPFSGRSDYGPFIEVGIPAGGLFSGAEVVKDSTGRSIFKGLANTPYDPCYHGYCDSYDNISEEGLSTLAIATYQVTTYLANNGILAHKLSLNKKLVLGSGSRPYFYEQHPDAIALY